MQTAIIATAAHLPKSQNIFGKILDAFAAIFAHKADRKAIDYWNDVPYIGL